MVPSSHLPGTSSISMSSSLSSRGDGSSDEDTGNGRLQSEMAPYFCWRAIVDGESISMSGVVDVARASGNGRIQGVPLSAPAAAVGTGGWTDNPAGRGAGGTRLPAVRSMDRGRCECGSMFSFSTCFVASPSSSWSSSSSSDEWLSLDPRFCEHKSHRKVLHFA